MPKRGSSWRGLAALAKRDFHLLGQASPREQGLSFGTRRGVAYDETRGWAWTLEALGSDVDSTPAAEQLHA